jgi:hypothetical protein
MHTELLGDHCTATHDTNSSVASGHGAFYDPERNSAVGEVPNLSSQKP